MDERDDYADLDIGPAEEVSLRRLALVLLFAFLAVGAFAGWCWFGVLLPGANC